MYFGPGGSGTPALQQCWRLTGQAFVNCVKAEL
jgi:hypothetical protein